MEKDQNTNSEDYNNDAEENKAEKLNNDAQSDASENNEKIKEITSEEKILELELLLKWKTREEDLKKKEKMLLIMEVLLLQKKH
jgi:hypothetical protein